MINFSRISEDNVQLKIAKTFRQKLFGLIPFSKEKAPAIFFGHCNGIHTCFMRFPIDVYFLDKNLRVIKSVRNVKPFRLTRRQEAVATLEIPSHKNNKNLLPQIISFLRNAWGEKNH